MQFDNVGQESAQATLDELARAPRAADKSLKGPGYGTVAYPLSERIQSACKAWGIPDAARYYARHGIKIREFLILAGPCIRSARSI